jgi:hypothetical protein
MENGTANYEMRERREWDPHPVNPENPAILSSLGSRFPAK